MVLFAVPGILLLLRANESGGLKVFLGADCYLGVAFLMKQQGICFGLFGLAYLVWVTSRYREVCSKRFIGKMLTFGAGLILPFILTCVALAVDRSI